MSRSQRLVEFPICTAPGSDETLEAQKEKTRELLKQYGLQERDVLQLDRTVGGQSKL